ncbi:MAG: hypothetical protein K1X86_00170 [Ignavibacteria bacterium]|nr:hypothetical protein [Ignavibacteria bacterium]
MAKNQFSAVPNKWSFDQWNDYIPNMEYKIVSIEELPEFIKNNEQAKKFNSALVASSGNDKAHFFVAIGFRYDKKKGELDQEPYFVLFDKTKSKIPSEVSSGFIHHANFSGRTEKLDKSSINLLSTCGVTANITCVSIPQETTGQLFELQKKKLLTGTAFTVDFSGKKQEKEKTK